MGPAVGMMIKRFEHLKTSLESDLTRDLLFTVCNIILATIYQVQSWRHELVLN